MSAAAPARAVRSFLAFDYGTKRVGVATGNTLGSITRYNGTWVTSSATVECFKSVDGVAWSHVNATGRTNSALRLISTSGVLFSASLFGSSKSVVNLDQLILTYSFTLTSS